jgi:hypothetical protein
VYVGLLVFHLFNLKFIFLSASLPAVANEQQVLRMYSATSWFHSVAKDGHRAGVSPGLLPAKRTRLRSPASSSPANMAVNSPEPRNLPTITGWSWGCGLVLNLPKDVFSTRIRPSYGSVPCRALARSWWQAFSKVTGGLPIPPPLLTPMLGTLPIGICKSFFSPPPNDGGARSQVDHD